jgi:hypothetical protein
VHFHACSRVATVRRAPVRRPTSSEYLAEILLHIDRQRIQRKRSGGSMEKCQTCQYYDRKRTAVASSPSSGQCRRGAPQLNPVNAKSYLIEGVWPIVRDDDWCGEWKLLARRVDSRVAEALNAPLMSGPQSLTSPVPRITPVTPSATTTAVARASSAHLSNVAPAVMGRSASD